MSDTDQITDSAELHELRDSLSGVAMPERPRLEAITARGRACRRHRLSGAAGVSVAGVAAGIAVALGLTGAHGPAPVPGTTRTLAPGTIRNAAFKIVKQANGKATLTLTRTSSSTRRPSRATSPNTASRRRSPPAASAPQIPRRPASRRSCPCRHARRPCRRNPVCRPLLPSTRRPCQRAQSSASASSSSPAAGSSSPSR